MLAGSTDDPGSLSTDISSGELIPFEGSSGIFTVPFADGISRCRLLAGGFTDVGDVAR